MITVEKGQVWTDRDPRQLGRRLRVIHTDERYAYCRVVTDRAGFKRSQVGNTTRVLLNRFSGRRFHRADA